jgi:hypothetical protein
MRVPAITLGASGTDADIPMLVTSTVLFGREVPRPTVRRRD